MRKRPLDMIPFVDIMIAVLFIFATIEEGATESTMVPELQDQNKKLGEDVAQAKARETALELERDELAKAVAAGKEAVDRTLEGNRHKEVMSALLGEAQVIEVEIAGDLVGEEVHNRCCYRRFSLTGAWKTCQEVPTDAGERARWLDDGAGGLLDELHATGQTPTIVLVRQERDAAYNIGDKLGEQIRLRTPIRKTYSVTIETPAEHCSPTPPSP